MAQSLLLPIAKAKDEISILAGMANRHGLIAGATGTGKTVTLRVLAEQFSRIGVPVFMADIKGDLSGMPVAGRGQPQGDRAGRAVGLGRVSALKGIRWSSGMSSANRAIRSGPRSRRWDLCF